MLSSKILDSVIGNYTRTSFFRYYFTSLLFANAKALYLTFFVSEEYLQQEFGVGRYTLVMDIYGYWGLLPDWSTFNRLFLLPILFALLMIFGFDLLNNKIYDWELDRKNDREKSKFKKLEKPRIEREKQRLDAKKIEREALETQQQIEELEERETTNLEKIMHDFPDLESAKIRGLLEAVQDPEKKIVKDQGVDYVGKDLLNYLEIHGYISFKYSRSYSRYLIQITERGKKLLSELITNT